MIKNIAVYDSEGNETTMPLMATARTPRRYKQIFGRDLFREIEEISGDGVSEAERIEVVERLAFIMNAQAKGSSFQEIAKNPDETLETWLDTLDSAAITGHSVEIVTAYMENRRMGSETKNAAAQLSAR